MTYISLIERIQYTAGLIVATATLLAATTILSGCGDPSNATGLARSSDGPTYESEETERVISRMVEAHGGYEKWSSAPTIKYDNIFYNPFAQPGENPWWYSTEVIDQKTRNTYQNWRTDDALLVYDGERVWTTNWDKDNPPAFMVHFFYYFVNLPWLTQDEGVVLSDVERASVPGFEDEFYAVDMSFDDHPSKVKSGLDTYRLFIHPETYRLKAYHYSVGYGEMLDLMGIPEGELFGPTLRIHDEFVEVDGLLFPERMHTMPPDGSDTWGYHLLSRYSIDQPFMSEWLDMPADAAVAKLGRDR